MRKVCHCSLFLAVALSTTSAAASDIVDTSGRNNYFIISQAFLSGHDLHLRQDGSYNLAEIVQRGRDNNGFVEQSQLLSVSSDIFERLQLVCVSQLGTGGDVHLQQTGRNDAVILQASGSSDASSHRLQVGIANAIGVQGDADTDRFSGTNRQRIDR